MKKPNFEKPKEEAKKHQKESVSLVDELKIDKEGQEDFISEELEVKFWEDLYKEKLGEIKDDEDFKKVAIKELEYDIKSGKNGRGVDASRALFTISSMKKLGIYEKEIKEDLKEVQEGEDFKKVVINYLENGIKKGKNSYGHYASRVLWTISSIKSLGILKKEFENQLNKIKDDKYFKKPAIKLLQEYIKEGKDGKSSNASVALWNISSLKNLNIYKKEVKENLNKIKNSKKFKKTAVKDLEGDIKLGKDGDKDYNRWTFRTISSIKDISELWQELADKKELIWRGAKKKTIKTYPKDQKLSKDREIESKDREIESPALCRFNLYKIV